MRRARLAILLSSAAVAAGVAGTMAARTAEPPHGPLPKQAALLPPDASFVLGVDLRRLVESPLYTRFNGGPLEQRKQSWVDLERLTGLNAERDLTHLIAAGSGRSDDSGLALLLGPFERSKIEAALGKDKAVAATSREHAGRKLWMLEPRAGQKPQAMSVLDDGVIAAGSPVEVEAAIDRQKARGPGLTENATLTALAAKIDPSATFWMCGDQGLLSTVSGSSAKTAGWTIPAIKTFVASGTLDPDVAATILAQTADDGSAKNVTDLLRGLLVMLTMQAGEQQGLKDLASGIAIEQQGTEVKIGARFSYDTLARLAPPRPEPTPTPLPTRAPAVNKPPRKN